MTTFSRCRVLSTAPLPTTASKWITLVKTTYTDASGVTRDWESATRLTRPPTIPFDGVGILTILRRAHQPATVLLQRQFRPAIGSVTVEFPAGLVDAGESAEQCALRELREETGYIGTVVKDGVAPLMYNDPGMCDTNLHMVEVEVDLEKEENRRPVQRLDEGEFIECFEVEVEGLWEAVKKWEKEGLAVDARVGTLAMGLEVGRRLRG